MSFGDSDLSVFFADMGVSVTAFDGSALATPVKAQLDDGYTSEPTADGGMSAIAEAVTLTLPTGAISGLAVDKAITADSRSFLIRQVLKRDDGRITVLLLAEVTA